MMINKTLSVMICCVILLYQNGIAGRTPCDSTLAECTGQKIEKHLNNSNLEYWLFNFNDVYVSLNCRVCKIDTTTLKRELMRILVSEKVRASDTNGYMHKIAWRAMASKEVWSNDMERYVKKVMAGHKKTDIESYYMNAQLLIKRSPNWFRYAMEVYSINDTNHFSDRTAVYRAVMERFKNGGNPAEMNKVESLLYAVLRNKEYYDFYAIDEYLSKISNLYRNSKQRTAICTDVEKTYLEYRKKSSWSEMFDHIDSTKTYLSQIKTLTDYTPPLVIE